MGVEVEFVATDWKTLINGVVAGKYDIVMTGTSMTRLRQYLRKCGGPDPTKS